VKLLQCSLFIYSDGQMLYTKRGAHCYEQRLWLW